jgi:hypothetical protein
MLAHRGRKILWMVICNTRISYSEGPFKLKHKFNKIKKLKPDPAQLRTSFLQLKKNGHQNLVKLSL